MTYAHTELCNNVNRKYEVEFNLGYKLSALFQSDLEGIDKEFCEPCSTFNVHGDVYKSSVYQVSDVKIHDFLLPKMKIQEEASEYWINNIAKENKGMLPRIGHMGREVFEGKNFLLDFPQSKIIVCKNFKDLAKDRYKLEDFIQTPFFFDREMGISFPIETDTGVKILLLGTSCSVSFLRPSIVEEELSTGTCQGFPVWHTQKFLLGNHDFGERKLYFFNITSLFGNIDGFLGMDFLKEHAIYLDMEKSVAYIAKNSTAMP